MAQPRDAKGKFLPKGSKNLFKKKINKNKKKKTKRKRKSKKSPFNPSPLEDIAGILNPIKDIAELFGPVLSAFGGSPITKRTLAKAIKTHPGNVGLLLNNNGKRMAKRRRTNNNNNKKDVFPNFLTGKLEMDATGVFRTTVVNTPIPRLQTRGNKATVMELLWVEWFSSTLKFLEAGQQATWQMTIGAQPTAILDYDDSRVFAAYQIRWEAEVAAGAKDILYSFPVVHNFQSQDGHGYLLASDSFNFSGFSASATPVGQFTIHWKMFYRFIDIPLNEFIGLVQSTQS